MSLLARLRKIPRSLRLFEALERDDTTLLAEWFPFILTAFKPKSAPLPEPKRASQPAPKVVYRTRSDEEDLRDALDVGFTQLKFDSLDHQDRMN